MDVVKCKMLIRYLTEVVEKAGRHTSLQFKGEV